MLLLFLSIFTSTWSQTTGALIYTNSLELKCDSFPGRSLYHKNYCYLIIEADVTQCSEVMPAFNTAKRELTDTKMRKLGFLSESESTYTRGGEEFLNYKKQLCVLSKELYCPPDSELVSTKCFYLNRENRSHEEAIKDCNYKGMKMFYPHSDKDIKNVIEITSNSGLNEIWLSAVKEVNGIWEMNDILSIFDYARWFDTILLTSSSETLHTKLSIGSIASTPIGYMSVVEKSATAPMPSVCWSESSLEPVIVETTTSTTTPTTTTEACPINSHPSSSGCECNKGFVDILDTTIPDKALYKKRGLKCIASDPCHFVTKPLSIIFVIDASGSIGKTGWADLLSFIEKAAPLLPKKARIGFVKFSFQVTAKFWLRNNWTPAEFIANIPRQYDQQVTDTPEGILAAVELLKVDSNVRKTVVLFTDGVPYQPYKYPGDPGLKNAMRGALNELSTTRAKLLVVGFGPQIAAGRSTINGWLQNPKEDYFAYHEQTRLLTSDHMKYILTKICQQ